LSFLSTPHDAATPRRAASTLKPARTYDPETTKANILEVATEVFSEMGFAGARVDRIAAKTNTSKRMMYYYFKSKEGLYSAVLHNYYRSLRDAERGLRLETKPPLEALQELVAFTFNHHAANASKVRLVMVENMHKGRHMQDVPALEQINSAVIEVVAQVYARGVEEGVMRPGLDPWDIYASIAALSFFNVSNRYTISAVFKHDMGSPEAIAARTRATADMIVRYVQQDAARGPERADLRIVRAFAPKPKTKRLPTMAALDGGEKQ
jgi:AcrR family transcriptional regulator